MVAGGIAAATLMLGLHFFLFGPRVNDLKKAAESRDAQKNLAANIKIADQKDIDALTSRTTASLDLLTSGVTALGMSQHENFVLPTFADLVPPAATPPSQQDIDRLKEKFNEKIDKEVQMVLAQVRRTQEFARSSSAAGNTKLTFLGGPPATQGWALPLALPQQVTRDPNALLDVIKRIAELKRALNVMTPDTDAYNMGRVRYFWEISQKLGVDYFYTEGNLLFRDQPYAGWPGVANFGEFVPVIDKLALANLILEQVAKYESVPGRVAVIPGIGRLNRETVFDIIDINLDDIGKMIDGMKENKLYFLYEELLNVNNMLDMASKQKLTDITFVSLDGYAYLRKYTDPGQAAEVPKDLSKLITGQVQNDEITIAEVKATVAAPVGDEPMMEGMDYGVEGGGEPQEGMEGGGAAPPTPAPGATPDPKALPGTPKDDEIGIALPIKLIYQATNDKTWKFIYDVLRAQPMTELQRMQFRTMSQFPGFQNNQNVESTVTFVIVPKMFSVVDDVRKQLQSIRSGAAAAPQAAEPAQM